MRPVLKERCQGASGGPSSEEAEDKQAAQREKEWALGAWSQAVCVMDRE